MRRGSKKTASNIEINRGSILLLFSKEDTEIVNGWINSRKKVNPTPDTEALRTRENIRALGKTVARIYPVEDTPCFEALLLAIDEADRQVREDRVRPKLARAPRGSFR